MKHRDLNHMSFWFSLSHIPFSIHVINDQQPKATKFHNDSEKGEDQMTNLPKFPGHKDVSSVVGQQITP